MTYFRPEQRSFINYVIIALILASLAASVMVIWAYNRSVNFGHVISDAQLNIRKVQTENSQLQEKIFALLNDTDAGKLSNGALIEEKNPQYLKTGVKTSGDLAVSQVR